MALCNLIISNSTFESNFGVSLGGAIYYNYNRPMVNDSTFTNNSAEYGQNFASYAVQIRMVGDNSDKMTISSMVSGVQYNQTIKFYVVDSDNQTMVLNNVNHIIINPINKSSVSMKGTNSAILRNGIATFNNLVINTQPGSSNVQFNIYSKAIDFLKIKEAYGLTKDNLISANFRF